MITAQEARTQLNELFHLDEIKNTQEFKTMMRMLDANIRAVILNCQEFLWVGNNELEAAAIGSDSDVFSYIPHLIRELETLGYTAELSYSEAEREWGIRICW